MAGRVDSSEDWDEDWLVEAEDCDVVVEVVVCAPAAAAHSTQSAVMPIERSDLIIGLYLPG